jgi:hypothetical protein
MADHAPELLPPRERVERWLQQTSDVRLSAYMVTIAILIGVLTLFMLGRS